MTIHHHLSDVTLGAYVAGSLSEAMSLVVASHISLCPICFERKCRMEAIGGAFLQNAEPEKMSINALQTIMASLDQQGQEKQLRSDQLYTTVSLKEQGISVNPGNSETALIPDPLKDYMPDNLDDVKWKSLAPGIKYCAIPSLKTDGGTLCMLNISPGTKIPEHGHQGTELTQVLKGSFSDDVGCFGVGDIVDLDDNTEHQPVVSSDQSCICLIASEAPLKFNGLIPKVAHYLSGM